MGTYVVKHRPPNPEQFKTWVLMGYTGSYEQYAASVKDSVGANIFMKGDLGPHCTECAAPGNNLCDYPVGNDKTCDRPLCDEHARLAASDTHYCRDHWIMWNEYLASERGYDVLANVTPLGIVRATQGTEARRAETVKHGSVHDGPVAESDAPNPLSQPSERD